MYTYMFKCAAFVNMHMCKIQCNVCSKNGPCFIFWSRSYNVHCMHGHTMYIVVFNGIVQNMYVCFRWPWISPEWTMWYYSVIGLNINLPSFVCNICLLLGVRKKEMRRHDEFFILLITLIVMLLNACLYICTCTNVCIDRIWCIFCSNTHK